MTSLSEKKSALRREAKQKVFLISPGSRVAAGTAITRLVVSLPEWEQAETVLLYAATQLEPATVYLIREGLKAGKRVCLPRCLEGGEMEAVVLRSPEELVPGKYGIGEPSGKETVPPEEIGLAVIPCVAAGRDGTRLGHGAGYYDRYLAKTDAFRLCLCFEAAMYDTLPTEGHDRRMEAVVTEKEILRF